MLDIEEIVFVVQFYTIKIIYALQEKKKFCLLLMIIQTEIDNYNLTK